MHAGIENYGQFPFFWCIIYLYWREFWLGKWHFKVATFGAQPYGGVRVLGKSGGRRGKRFCGSIAFVYYEIINKQVKLKIGRWRYCHDELSLIILNHLVRFYVKRQEESSSIFRYSLSILKQWGKLHSLREIIIDNFNEGQISEGSSYFVHPHKRLRNPEQHFFLLFYLRGRLPINSFEIKCWQAKHYS